ncbi:hypothetical protein ACFQ1E_00770 [Sphingomonas canadensis]|uniref:Uncharacterized protein n=1 Tax=Sphingomonas canadensis TaxID=1219257 RepID=A0ABW3H092_9SPHN|nr:hypothetical protein [Sphingomonas canadensis]MCW3835228.1 hypothetical protein [Sphingomonas canadensis]
MSDTFIIKYDGGDADSHAIDMRLLGESLQGIDRLISDLLIIGVEQRLPKKGERAPLVVKAHEPQSGTVTIPVTIQEAAGLFQIGWQIFGPNGADALTTWFRGLLAYHTGKTSEAEQAMQHVANMAQRQADLFQQVEDHRHTEMMGMQALLMHHLPKTSAPMVQAVAPVGRTVKRLWFWAPKQERIEATERDAEIIRAKAELEWTDLTRLSLQTDGYVFHNRKLSVVHPFRTGFFNAEVENNPYAVAGAKKAMISVDAKLAYRAGDLERIVILNFGGEIGDAA